MAKDTYGLDRLIANARDAALQMVAPGSQDWHPDAPRNYAAWIDTTRPRQD